MFSTSLFLFHFIESDNPQYSFVAPKKNFKKAVERNKFRRIGYNIIRAFPIKAGTGAFIYKKTAISSTNQEIKENILFILKKAGIYS